MCVNSDNAKKAAELVKRHFDVDVLLDGVDLRVPESLGCEMVEEINDWLSYAFKFEAVFCKGGKFAFDQSWACELQD